MNKVKKLEVIVEEDDFTTLCNLAKAIEKDVLVTASACLSYGIDKLMEENEKEKAKEESKKIVHKALIRY